MKQRTIMLFMTVFLLLKSMLMAQNGLPIRGNYFDKIKQITESGSVPKKATFDGDLGTTVNTLTGAAFFSIPLYTISVGGYDLPICLHYETSGVKLVDIASNVGMGWNIIAGGSITRTVKGLPDELEQIGYRAKGLIADSIHGCLLNLAQREDFDTLGQNPPPEDVDLFASLLDISDNLIDSEPDIYSFDFAGYSGCFVFDMSGNPHFIPEQNFQIEGTDTTCFVITVDNGDKYYFGSGNAKETVQCTFNCPLAKSIGTFETNNSAYYYPNRYWFEDNPFNRESFPNHNISWHLTRIELSESSQTILFEYDSDDIRTYLGTDESYMIGRGYLNPTVSMLESGHDWTVHRINRYRFSQVPRLRRIVWNNGSVEFIPSSSYREDLDYTSNHNLADFGGRSIKRMEVTSMDGDNGINDHFSVVFRQSYIKDIGTTAPSPNGIPNEYRSYYKRLFLDTLVFNNRDNNKIYEYVFDYNRRDTLHTPSRNSCEIDAWGYFKPRNANMVERYPVKPRLYYYQDGKENPLYNSVYSVWRRSGATEPTCVLDGYSDMAPDSIGSKEFTLKYVKLPTGGLVSFDYEPNDFHFDDQDILGPGVRVRSVVYNSGDGMVYRKSYDYKKNGHSSGKISSIPNIGLYTYVPIQAYGAPADNSDCGRQDYLTSRQVSTVADMGCSSSSIQYGMVTETTANDSLGTGKTVYHYQVNFTASDSLLMAGDDVFVRKTHCCHSHAFACPPYTICNGPFYVGRHLDATPNFTFPIISWYNGFLTKVEQFDNEDRLVESTEYKYSLRPRSDSILYIQAKFLEKYADTWKLYNPNYENYSYEFVYQYDILWGVNYYRTGARLLDTVVTKRYDVGSFGLAHISTITNTYNPQNYLSEEKTIDSDGSVVQQFYTYPADYDEGPSNTVLHDMVVKNMLKKVIEHYVTIDGKTTQGTLLEYERIGNGGVFIKPEKLFVLRTDTPLMVFHPSTTSDGPDSHYELSKQASYSSSSGNLVETWDEKEGTTAYVWGYHDNLLLATVRNATSTQVQAALTCTNEALQEITDPFELRSVFQSLRTSLSQAMVTSYTYDLFGKLTSVTDPAGKKKSFGYDASLRLKTTHDDSGNILNKFEYHYKQ